MIVWQQTKNKIHKQKLYRFSDYYIVHLLLQKPSFLNKISQPILLHISQGLTEATSIKVK